VIDRLSLRIAEGRKVDLLDFDLAGLEVHHATIGIGSHLQSPFRAYTMHHFDVMRFLRTVESRGRPSGHHSHHDHRSTDVYWDCRLRPQPGLVETLLTSRKIDFGRLAAIGSVLRETYAVLRLRVMRAGQLRGSNTRITRHRDGQASTRCYSGGILVLIVAATALCRDQGNDCARRRTDRRTLKGANARAYQP
jgi:hypothetical protein